MRNPEAFSTNGMSDLDGGLPSSLLDSASLEDSSALTGLWRPLRTASGLNPVSSELNRISTLDTRSNPTSLVDSAFNNSLLLNQPRIVAPVPSLPLGSNSTTSDSTTDTDLLTGSRSNTSLVSLTNNDPLTNAASYRALANTERPGFTSALVRDTAPGSTNVREVTGQSVSPTFAVRTEGTLTINSSGDFDGEPADPKDDALIYAGRGFTINGNPVLPVQRDANGNPLRDSSGKLLLVDRAVAVAQGYTVSNAPNNQYANLLPPQVVDKQTVTVPAYADVRQQELARRIPASTATVTFNAQQNPVNNASEWASKFPAPGTAGRPTVVRVTNGGLNIPANVTLNNYVITVEGGDINFNGSGHNLNNVMLVASNGNVNLANVSSSDLSVLASGSLNMNGGARFAGSTLLANGNSGGNITFNGATTTTNSSDNLKVISQGDITYNSASNTRGEFLSGKNFTFNSNSRLLGAIGAKGNIIFNNNATVVAVTNSSPDNTPPEISGGLVRDTAPGGTTNTDRVTSDPTIAGTVTDTSQVTAFRAGFDNTPTSSYVNVLSQRSPDGSFTLSRTQLAQVYGGTLPDGVHTLHLQAQDQYGNVSNVFDVPFILDTQAPGTPTSLGLTASTDSGASNSDNVTNNTAPSIQGNAAAGSLVQLFSNGQLTGQVTASTANTWQIATSNLANGTHTLTATATDIAGNLSNPSTALALTIDTALPNLAIANPVANASLTPGARIIGTADGTGSTVVTLAYRLDNLAAVPLSLSTTGAFNQELDFSQIDSGPHTLTVSTTDQAGNTTTQSFSVQVNKDTTPPAITATLANDTAAGGVTNADGITADPTMTGTVTDASAIASFRAGFDQTPVSGFFDVTADLSADGSFTFNRSRLEEIYGGFLPDGAHTLHLLAEDAGGNVSNVFDVAFTLDTTSPIQPGFTLAPEFDTAPVGDAQTTAETVTLVGQTEANISVLLQESGITTTANASGRFEFTGVGLTVGANPLTVRASDLAGNQSLFTNAIARTAVDNSDVVIDWNATLLQAVQRDGTPPPAAARNMAMVHAAVYDAVNAIERTHNVYHVDAQAPAGASAAAAAAAAAHRTLVNLYPQQTATFDAELVSSLSEIPDGTAESNGVALGQTVADAILAWRSTDGASTVVSYTPGTNPGDWQPTPPNFAPALLPQWPDVTPFAITSGSQFRPAGPSALDSAEYTADFNYVKEIGRSNSTTRTAEQTEIARFWSDGSGTYTPPGHWNQIAEQVSVVQGNTLSENARLFALLNISMADAGIAAWDAKYEYNQWRPVTAIRQADMDGNPATISDPTWTSLLVTPPFPDYISGHSTFSGAADAVLTSFFSDDKSFTSSSIGLPGVNRDFTNFSQAADEASLSRVYGGIHFPLCCADGLTVGRTLGDYVLQNFLVSNPTKPQLQAGLANDTGPNGVTNTDSITSDPAIAGSVTNAGQIARLRAGFDATPVDSFVDIFANLGADGSFNLNRSQLEQIYGAPLADGTHTLHLQAADATGKVLTTLNIGFQLDTTAPVLSLEAPLSDGQHSNTARLIGSVVDAGAGVSDVRYARVDNSSPSELMTDARGRFDQVLQSSTLSSGDHNVSLTVFDQAGNLGQTAVDFQVTDDFVIGPSQTVGWGAKTADSLVLDERNSFVVQTAMPLELGQAAGTRQLRLELDARFDTTDQSAAIEDQFLMYLVDAANPNQTLLGRGDTAGTALFSLAGDVAEFTPGLVRYDGSIVEVDLTSLAAQTNGQLVFQLLNSDADSGSVVRVNNLTNELDPEGVTNPVFPEPSNNAAIGPALNLAALNPADDVKLLLNHVRFDALSGRYTAQLQLHNTGQSVSGRQVAVVFPDLPAGVQLLDVSGTDSSGSPYVNLRNAVPAGGLDSGALSDTIQIVFDNPERIRFPLQPVVLVGPPNQAPTFEQLGPLSVMPGDRLELPLVATDPDGDLVTFSLQSDGALPTGELSGNGTLIFTPTPAQLGTYNFTLVASDGAMETTQAVTMQVVADPVTTTRISGVIQNTDQQPLAGIPIELGDLQTLTQADGSFILEVAGELPSDTLKVHGEDLSGSIVYPFIAEKLPLMLEHDPFTGVNNVISRPIYLPPIDIANAKTIDPTQDVIVTTDAIPGAAVTVAAGTLEDQQGQPYTGQLSITEVPRDLTPAALPENLHPDLVVTIQPGEMVFTTPAPLALPNLAGYAAGTLMDLWSINPTTGLFDNVGTGQVSADGSVIETISGGIRNSSWHFFAPPVPAEPQKDPRNPDEKCDYCQATQPLNSEVELHSGAVRETHELVPYKSLGATRGLMLQYDSLRADPRPIVHFGYDGIQAGVGGRLVAELVVKQGNFTYQVPGVAPGQYSPSGGEHFWSLPTQGGDIDAALQVDLRSLPTGRYTYELTTGVPILTQNGIFGSTTTSSSELISINKSNSPFGSGWELAGWQSLVENADGSVLLVDGDGTQVLFEAPTAPGLPYISPVAEVSTEPSTLERLADGTFRRTMKDQTIYHFNAQNQLELVRDRQGNQTQYVYNGVGQLTQMLDPVGLATTFTYTGSKVSAITDPAGRITQMEYDTAGNLTRITDPDGSQRTWDYDTNHHMTTEINQGGHLEATFYDFAGRAMQAIRPDGTVVQVAPVQVQGLYQPTATINPFNAPATFALGPVESSYADGNGNVVSTLLDQAGQAVSSIDGDGFLPSVQRNEQNLVTQSTDARDHVTEYTYDALGNVTSVKDELSVASTTTSDLFPNQIYKTGSYPHSITAGDFDNDGNLDLVTANRYDNSVSVLFGDGDGAFSGPLNIAIGNSPEAVAVGDVNGDGKLDLVTANNYDNSVSVLLGDGGGSFGTPTSFAVGNGPEAVAAGDLDSDGDLDLVTAGYGFGYGAGDQNVSVLLNNGLGDFAAATNYTVGNGPASSVTVGDVNGDGRLDLVATSLSSNSVSVLLGNGNGDFAASSDYLVGSGPTSVALGDVNSDGQLDLVTANSYDNSVSVLFGDGVSFSSPTNFAVGNNPEFVVLGDLDGDGDPDVVTSGFGYGIGNENVSVLLNNGDGDLTLEEDAVGNSFTPTSIALSDVNSDGVLDLATANSYDNVSVLLGNSDGTFAPKPDVLTTDYSVGSSPTSVVLSDVNRDSSLDLLTAIPGSDSVSVRLGNGDGTLAAATNYAVGSGPEALAVGDVNGDTELDLVSANRYDNSVSVLLADGQGAFSSPTNFAVGSGPQSVTLGDLDGDGDLDLVTAGAGYDSNVTLAFGFGYGVDENVSVLLNNGNGSFAADTNYAVGSGPTSVALGDVNSDTELDLVTANSYDNSVSVLLGTGNGSFAPKTDYVVGNGSGSVTVGDVNSDTELDLVTANSYDNSVSVLLGNGDGTFASKTDYAVGRGPESVAVRDVNGDGLVDLVTANVNDNSVSVLLSNGAGSFLAKGRRDFAVGNGPQSLALGDLNLDGKLDLISANTYGNSVSVRLNSVIQIGTGERRYTYDPVFNQLTSETDELGRQTLYEIAPNTGNLLSTTRVVGAVGGTDDLVTSSTYTVQGQIDTVTDPLGRVTDYDYDAFGRLLKTTFAKGTVDEAVQQFEYDAAGNQTAMIDENGNRTQSEYDAMNRLVKTIEADPDGSGLLTSPVTTYDYDLMGNQVSVTDARSNVTQSEYDVMNRLTQTVDAQGGETSYSYDQAGNQVSVVDPLNRETQSLYDARDRLIETIHPDGSSEKPRYDFDNNQTSTTDVNGNRTNSVYDARGRLIRQIDPLGNVTRFEYDAANQLIAQIDANGNRTQYRYDEMGRQIAVVDAQENITTTAYDQVGNVIAQTDALEHTTRYTYDGRDRQTVVTDALDNTTTTAYDAVGNVVAVTDPAGNTTTSTYDGLNRLTAETNALGATRSYSYDAMGNRTAAIDRNGRARQFIYDAMNRQMAENWLDASGNPIRTITSTYDAASQLTAVNDPDSNYNFTYDALGRRTSVDNQGTPGVPNVLLNYTHDRKGNVLSVADTVSGQAGGITAYTYDHLDRVNRITQNGNGVGNKRVDFTYDPIGQIASLKRYTELNGTQLVAGTTYNYDSLNRLQNLKHSNASDSTLAFYNFGYDAASRITQITDVDGTTNYTYDNTNQLTGADRTDPNNPDEAYTYDANGNRVSSSLHGSIYVTGLNNRLQSDSMYNYEYDNEGNLTRQTEIATRKVREFEWDYRSRLIAVTDKDAAGNLVQEVAFTYDAMNHRIAKTVDTNPLDAIDGTVTYFVNDRDNVLLEFVDNDGAAGANEPVFHTRYLHGPRVDQVLAQEDADGAVVWQLTDHLGTVRNLANNSGAVVNHISYDSFGSVISQTNTTVDTRYLYTGREFDEETGLYYYRARYYDANLGRFLSEDPLGFSGGDTNLYAYVANSPTDTVDPSGQFGRVSTQTRLIIYLDNGINSTTNIQDIINAQRQNPNVSIISDSTTANIEYSRSNTGRRINADPPSMKKPPFGFDQRGHIVGRQLGGGGDINNAFAQDPVINNGIWRGFETTVRNTLDRKNQPGCPPVTLKYSINLSYLPRNPFLPLRPGLVTGRASFSDNVVISRFAPNP